MHDLQHLTLDQLIELALQERLIDACERRAKNVVIVQRSLHVVFSHERARAFLRGVLRAARLLPLAGASSRTGTPRRGVSASSRRGGDRDDQVDHERARRRQLLAKWWERYELAGRPFHPTVDGMEMWVRYGTYTTAN